MLELNQAECLMCQLRCGDTQGAGVAVTDRHDVRGATRLICRHPSGRDRSGQDGISEW